MAAINVETPTVAQVAEDIDWFRENAPHLVDNYIEAVVQGSL